MLRIEVKCSSGCVCDTQRMILLRDKSSLMWSDEGIQVYHGDDVASIREACPMCEYSVRLELHL